MGQYMVFVGVVIQLAGIYVYIKQTIKGETKPNGLISFFFFDPFVSYYCYNMAVEIRKGIFL